MLKRVLLLVLILAGLALAQSGPDSAASSKVPATENDTTLTRSQDPWWKLTVLGVVQGLTEFLPVSSSGHLVLGQELLDFRQAGVGAVVFLHLGTLFALLFFFARPIGGIISSAFSRDRKRRANGWRIILYIAIGSVPAAVVGLLAGDVIDRIFTQPAYVSIFLLGTGLLLLLTRWRRDKQHALGVSDAILMGIAQAVAILPGFSRSGLTISTGLLLGLAEEEAFRFSFLLSIPAIAAANLLKIRKIITLGSPLGLALGFVFSLGVGILALWILRRALISRKFWLFSFYCFGLGLASAVLLLVFG